MSDMLCIAADLEYGTTRTTTTTEARCDGHFLGSYCPYVSLRTSVRRVLEQGKKIGKSIHFQFLLAISVRAAWLEADLAIAA